MVFYQSESFAYQYYVFLLPAVVGLVIYEIDTPIQKPGKKLKRENIIAVSVVLLFSMWCVLYSPQPIWGLEQNYGVQELKMNNYFWNDSEQINKEFNFTNQTSILFMDTGSAVYYFHDVNSSCRYPAPLVIQRVNPGRMQVLNLTQNKEEYECIMNYSGKYIIADGKLGDPSGWFGMDTEQKQIIVEKILGNYTSVHSGGWEIYKHK
jgi:hypothetical protein